MKKIQMKKQNEDAVSPVIGVMLMLVVTIIIAAVVAAFASGLGGDVEAAPAAILDVDVYTDGKVKISSLSGDSLVTKEITVKVQDVDSGNQLGVTTNLEYDESYFTPGSTTSVNVGADLSSYKNKHVTVIVLSEGKHVILNKEIIVKQA